MKFLLPLLRNNILQLSHANQLRYADTKNRTKTITLYMLIAAILMGLLAYLIYSLKIIYSIAWSLEEVVTELVIPMVLICVSLNIAISVFWGSGLLLSDTNIDSMLALPIPLRTLILSKLTVLFMVEVALTVALLLPMMVLFGLTADMGFPFYLIVLGITIIFPVIPGLLGTMIGTQIYRILKSSSARIARLKAAAAILVLFAFMIFMFCKFPDIAAGNFGDVISTSTFTLYADQYIHRLFTLRLKWPWTTITSAKIPARAFTASSRRMAALQNLNGGSHSLKRNSRISCVLLPSPLHTAIGSPS